ncbi:MAG: hypothetical protein NVSMB29_02760 [Candidatus Dormibacteria bacterium]
MRVEHAWKVLSLAGLALSLAGCAGGATAPAGLEVACPNALLRLDQVSGSNFQLEDPAPSTERAAGAQPSADAHLRSAAEVRYFRPTRDLQTSNGPVDITAGAACYRDPDSASRALAALSAAGDRTPGAIPISAGPLGDEDHATVRRASAPNGTPLAQITLRWRLSTVLTTMTVRGREGAFGLSDVVGLAARQQENELAITTPSPPPPRPAGAPSAAPTGTPAAAAGMTPAAA